MAGATRPPTREDREALAQAHRLKRAGNLRGAFAAIAPVAKRRRSDVELQLEAGYLALQVHENDAAVELLARAARLAPDRAACHAHHALALCVVSRVDEGLAAADRALDRDPNDWIALYAKGELLRMSGRLAEACDLLSDPVRRPEATAVVVVSFAASAAGCGRAEDGERALRSRLEAGELSAPDRSSLLYRLGLILDKRGDHGGAFAAIAEANREAGGRFDPERFGRDIGERIGVWTRERLAQLPRARTRADDVVLIVGMPRSGTTLVEQIIASHSRAAGAGERGMVLGAAGELLAPSWPGEGEAERVERLKAADIDRVARRETAGLRKVVGRAARVIDKMPTNFLHLGLAELMLPGARVIHCVRDPVDTCVSCYFQQFTGANNHPYATDLGWLGAFYTQYRRLMAHWERVLSMPMLEVRYEQMVGDQEAQSRRVIEFLDLEWEDACLRFHETERDVVTLSSEQVRRPMYKSSVGRREKYGERLGPLVEALGAWASA